VTPGRENTQLNGTDVFKGSLVSKRRGSDELSFDSDDIPVMPRSPFSNLFGTASIRPPLFGKPPGPPLNLLIGKSVSSQPEIQEEFSYDESSYEQPQIEEQSWAEQNDDNSKSTVIHTDFAPPNAPIQKAPKEVSFILDDSNEFAVYSNGSSSNDQPLILDYSDEFAVYSEGSGDNYDESGHPLNTELAPAPISPRPVFLNLEDSPSYAYDSDI
jgi:hypothetical protein